MWAYIQMGRPDDAMEALRDHLQAPRPLPYDGIDWLLAAYFVARRKGGIEVDFKVVERRLRSYGSLRGLRLAPLEGDADAALKAFHEAIEGQGREANELAIRARDAATLAQLDALVDDAAAPDLTPWLRRKRQLLVARHRKRFLQGGGAG